MKLRLSLGLLFIAGLIVLTQQTMIAQTRPSAFLPISNEHLENAHIVTSKVISGAQPEDDAAFKALRDLGVKTIISVDGAAPDVEAAKKYGIRYVHIPITYGGVTEAQGKAIAKAIDELPGLIYLHCHHGKHRSAAAVAVACVMNGQLKPEQAESVLKTFDTGDNYKGLWKAALDARPLDAQELKAIKVEYVETARIDDLAQVMVAIDHSMDNIRLTQKSNWQSPKDHPAIDPAHEALMVQEHLHEIGRTDIARDKSDRFRALLAESDEASKAMHEALSQKPLNAEGVNTAFARVNASCTACHKVYRD